MSDEVALGEMAVKNNREGERQTETERLRYNIPNAVYTIVILVRIRSEYLLVLTFFLSQVILSGIKQR